VFSEEEKCNWENIQHQLRKNCSLRDFELKLSAKNGENKFVLFSGSSLKNKNGKPIGITCIITDITERTKIEEMLLKAQRLASIGELAGQIGHDLRNPLAAIKNGVYLIEKKGALIPEVKQSCEWIKTSIADSDRIISSLVDYAQDLNLKKEICTPKSLTQNALSKVTIPKRILLSNLVTNETELFLDAQKIENAFTRIIHNAIDAMPESGILEISSQPLNESVMCISFTDSGTGISETIMPNLFAPLTTTKAKGMGMGLAICKRIVEAHEGVITFESAINKGSTFTFILPINSSTISNRNPSFT
jgi:signal transduction histidine kinase